MKILIDDEKVLPIIKKADLEKAEDKNCRFYMDSKGQIFISDKTNIYYKKK